MADPGSEVLAAVWRQQSVWSQGADRAKRASERTRQVTLALTVAVAVLGTAAAQTAGWSGDWPRGLAFAAALSVGLSAVLAARASGIQAWTRARSVSETIKSLMFSCLAGVAPFRGPDAPALLLHEVERVVADVADLADLTTGLTAAVRALPAVTDVASYAALRVSGQVIGYYRPKAVLMRRRVRTARRSCLALSVCSAVLAAATVAFAWDQAAAWIGVVTTVSIAITANAAQSRSEYQQLEFSRTADELDRLLTRRQLTTNPDAAADDEFVRRCEHVISRQNEGWMAKWSAEWV